MRLSFLNSIRQTKMIAAKMLTWEHKSTTHFTNVIFKNGPHIFSKQDGITLYQFEWKIKNSTNYSKSLTTSQINLAAD